MDFDNMDDHMDNHYHIVDFVLEIVGLEIGEVGIEIEIVEFVVVVAD